MSGVGADLCVCPGVLLPISRFPPSRERRCGWRFPLSFDRLRMSGDGGGDALVAYIGAFSPRPLGEGTGVSGGSAGQDYGQKDAQQGDDDAAAEADDGEEEAVNASGQRPVFLPHGPVFGLLLPARLLLLGVHPLQLHVGAADFRFNGGSAGCRCRGFPSGVPPTPVSRASRRGLMSSVMVVMFFLFYPRIRRGGRIGTNDLIGANITFDAHSRVYSWMKGQRCRGGFQTRPYVWLPGWGFTPTLTLPRRGGGD